MKRVRMFFETVSKAAAQMTGAAAVPQFVPAGSVGLTLLWLKSPLRSSAVGTIYADENTLVGWLMRVP